MSNRAALFVQAIRGPLLLITIGLLFVFHQAGIISFSRTWPLIIIVIGLVKLIERMLAPSVPPPAMPGPYMSGPPPGGPPVGRP
ncbi:MAG TPA: DUF5668 domain-containing protein [Bryobacteraceae bacterium]|nr:DUF5668 domain-containing protein [Bryobacteraceae bacterium]